MYTLQGYCEGVVGRFEAAHVRFHGKLKRPVMTKRSSSAAPSPAPSTSASPSPRISSANLPPRDASPLRQSSLANGSFGASGSNGIRSRRSSSRATDRDTEIITDPFDLERLASRTVAPRSRRKSRSRSGERDRGGVEHAIAALNANLNERAEEKERWEKARAEEVSLTELETRSSPARARPVETHTSASMPFKDTSPSSPRYTPVTPPPRTASKSQVPLQNGVRSAQTLPSPPNSPPKSRKSEDNVVSDGESSTKSGQKRTRVAGDMPGLELFMTRNVGGSGSRSGSADENRASRANSQDNAKEEKTNRRRTRLLGMSDLTVLGKQLSDSPPPSPLPPPSPMRTFPSYCNSQTLPYPLNTEHQPDAVNDRTSQHRKKSTDDDEKSRKRRTGIVGDWTLAVGSEGVVTASPSPFKTEFNLSDKEVKDVDNNESTKPDETSANAVHVISTVPPPSEPFGELQAGALSAPPLEISSSQSMHQLPEQELEVSSLYDRGSLYSTSTHSHELDESISLTSGFNVDSSRFTASEDGGLGLGIGLTMLQDMVDADSGSESESDYGEDDAGADAVQNANDGLEAGRSTPRLEVGEDADVPPTPRPLIPATKPVDDQSNILANIPLHNTNAVAVGGAQEEAPEEEEQEEEPEWDDEEFYGDDIYDNYRYSRYSMMSKVSKRKSRFSVMTTREPDSPQSMAFNAVPPIPAVRERKDSGSSSLRSYPSPTEEKDRKGKHVPPPLNLVSNPSPAAALLSPTILNTPTVAPLSFSGKQNRDTIHSPQPSPLLHTNFPSPNESSSRATSLGTPLISPNPSISSFSSRSGVSPGNSAAAGAASALRQKLETERSLSPGPSPIPGASPGIDGFGKGIVVEDDDEIHVEVVPADQSKMGDETMEADKSRISIDSMASVSVESAAPSVASTSTDVTREMHRIEADLASVLQNPSVNPSTTSLPAGGDPRTPTVSEYAISLTQPLRLHERQMQRPEPPHELSHPQQQPPPHQPPPAQLQPHQIPIPRPLAQLTPEQALFRPHPGAPPPNPAVVSGQRISTYGMPPAHTGQPSHLNPQQSTLVQTMRMAAAGRMGPNGVPRNTTIFGKTVVDLSNSLGPVAMVWSIDPFPPEPQRTNSPGPGRGVPRRSTTAGSSPLSMSVNMPPPSTPTPPPEFRATPSPQMRASPSPQIRASPSPSSSPVPTSSMPPSPGIDGENRGSRVLPRANFLPQVGTPRPRSRSFSGSSSESPVNSTKERSSEDVSRPTRSASYQSLRQASTSPSGSAVNRGSKAPSPLSLPQNHIGPGLKAPPSPLSRPPLSPVQPEQPVSEPPVSSVRISTRNVLRKVASAVNVSTRSERSSTPTDKHPPPPAPPQPRRSNSVQADDPSASSPPSGSTTVLDKLRRISSTGSGKKHQRSVSQHSRSSSNSDTTRSNVVSPPLIRDLPGSSVPRRSNSLKSKLSLSHLRLKKDTVPENQVLSPTTASGTLVFEFDEKPETVHVQDAEFEMVTPVIMRNSSEANGSIHTREERPSIQSEIRSDSPATISLRSVGPSRSPMPNGKPGSPSEGSQSAKPTEDTAQIEAHRTRELKWISAMSSIPAAQARKNKKMRKLVLEGVPASVRYLVWAHLTDSKSKQIPGVYGQLGKRGKVAAAEAIERDAQRCFPDQAHLRDPKGPLVSLLQTYLTMVPDIEYQTSTLFQLAFVARGH